MADITYVASQEESLSDIAKRMTGYAEYATAIAEYNSLPASGAFTLAPGGTVQIPEQWLVGANQPSITVTGGNKFPWWIIALGAAVLMLNACATIPDSAMDTIYNAGAGCAKASGLWGNIIVMAGNADKGVIRNGEIIVASDCGGITIRDSRIPPVAPIR